MEARDTRGVSERVNRPFIVFRRTVNKGIRGHKSITKDGREHVTQLGEHEQEWKCYLADKRGEACSWATVLGIQQYISKGYVPIALGGFEEFLARKDPNQDMVKELAALYGMLQRSVAETNELESLRKANEELQKQLAEALASSNDPALKEKLAKLEAQAKEKEAQSEQRIAKLQEDMAAQAKELDEARKAEKKRQAQEAAGK